MNAIASGNAPPRKLISQLLPDEADLREVIVEFVRGLPGQLEEIRAARLKLDWDQMRILAHRLKGSGGSYGYPEISVVAAEMEREFVRREIEQFEQRIGQLAAIVESAKAGLV